VSWIVGEPGGSHPVPLGYSYKSSQYGLTVDNIAGYELVLPNGTVTYVTSKDKDLWFGLRVSGKLGTYR
jgi:FAD/FMN-containing dehydrogenase